MPPSLPQLVPVKRSSGGTRRDGTVPHTHLFVWINHVIIANLQKLFPGMEVLEAHQFHVTATPIWKFRRWKRSTCSTRSKRACASAALARWCA
jgi:polyphosphate kinase